MSARPEPGDAPRHSLYAPEEMARLARRLKACGAALWAIPLASLLACVILCTQVRTRNAAELQTAVCVLSVLAGLVSLTLLFCLVRPGRAMLVHCRSVLAAEETAQTGVLRPTGEVLSIPGGIAVERWTLETDGETRSLHVAAGKAPLLPRTETPLRVWTARKFVTAWAGTLPAAPRPARPKRAFLSRLAGLVPLLLLWSMLSVLIWSFVFNILTDAPRAEKLVIYANTDVTHGELLADRLEQPEAGVRGPDSPVRMVRIYPFAHALMDSAELRGADLYLMTAADAETYREWLAPLPGRLADRPAEELLTLDGETVGVRLWQPGDPGGSLNETFAFAGPQAFYLCFGAGAPAPASGPALRAANQLLALR